jgi:hypothetical protein
MIEDKQDCCLDQSSEQFVGKKRTLLCLKAKQGEFNSGNTMRLARGL